MKFWLRHPKLQSLMEFECSNFKIIVKDEEGKINVCNNNNSLLWLLLF